MVSHHGHLDGEAAIQRSAQSQNETHKSLIRSRWMPAWVDAVDYGKFGRATVTATLFGDMDSPLYADFKNGSHGVMNAAEDTLKHAGGDFRPQPTFSNTEPQSSSDPFSGR